MNFLRLSTWVVHIAVIGVLLLFLYMFFPNINMDEDGPIEWLQAFVIVIAMCGFFYATIKNERLSFKISSIGFALLMFSFLIRELDVEKFGLPEFIRYYLGKEGKDQTMALVWGSYLFFWFVAVRQKIKIIKQYLGSIEGSIWYFTLALLVLSQMMDKNTFHLHHGIHHFLEEYLELISYAYILLISIYRSRQEH